jgi:hypothetical protein
MEGYRMQRIDASQVLLGKTWVPFVRPAADDPAGGSD